MRCDLCDVKGQGSRLGMNLLSLRMMQHQSGHVRLRGVELRGDRRFWCRTAELGVISVPMILKTIGV